MDEQKVVSLKEKFIYVKDGDQYGKRDAWYIMKPEGEGELERYRGDCEDFALTTLYQHCDESLLKFWWMLISYKAQITYCYVKTPERGHAVLRIEDDWTDNIFAKVVTQADMIDYGYVFQTKYFNPLTVAIKLLKGKWWKSQNDRSK